MGFTACSDEDEKIATSSTTVTINAPAGLNNPILGITSLIFKNVNTGQVIPLVNPANPQATSSFVATLPDGLYNVSAEGTLKYTVDGTQQETQFRADGNQISVSGGKATVRLDSYIYNSSKTSGFVLAEIFFTGTSTDANKSYRGDKYFVIYNNSGEALDAQGLAIAESAYQTITKRTYTPDVMNEAFVAQAIYRIPVGKPVMVQPGESLLLVDNAIDHRNANPKSWDLTKANYEWYDVSNIPRIADVDNDKVENLEKVYCYTNTIWAPHDRGFHSYVLARLGDDVKSQLSVADYTAKYAYDGTYDFVFPNTGAVKKMPEKGYQIPNKWVLDAVNISVQSLWQWNVTAPALDNGWTYCGLVNNDKTQFGNSVRRKVLSGKILQDTNNSTNDFIPQAKADPFHQFHP